MTKSCSTCPSFVKDTDSPTVYGRPTGCDSCSRHGHVLSRPTGTDAVSVRLTSKRAESCESHNDPSYVSMNPKFVVAIGDPSALVAGPPSASEAPKKCTECERFVPAKVVNRHFGWNTPMCAAQGRLIPFPAQYAHEALNCGVGRKGPNRTNLDNVTLLPDFLDDGGAAAAKVDDDVKSVRSRAAMSKHAVDPREYETDHPVSDSDRARFIRAWRSVDDPTGEKDPVLIPIFDGQALLTDHCQKNHGIMDHSNCNHDPRSTYGNHKPHLYVDHAGILFDLAVEFFRLDETPCAIGPAGTGKTEGFVYFAYQCDLPITRLSVNKNTEPWQFIGQGGLETDADGNVVDVWRDGRFPKAIEAPGIVIVDEANLQPEIMDWLRPMTDSAKEIVIDEAHARKGGKILRRHFACRMGFTQNPDWDPTNIGAEPMAAANQDRISPMYFDIPPVGIERDIIAAHCKDGGYDISTRTLDKIMQISKSIREVESLPIAWGVRSNVKVARKTQYYGLEKAYYRAVLDGLEPATRDLLLGIIRGVI